MNEENQTSPWQLKDKAWLANRKLAYKHEIEPLLKEFTKFHPAYYRKHELRFHKAYFLKGEILPYDEKWMADNIKYGFSKEESEELLGKPFRLEVVNRIWYHPTDDPDLFNQWLKEYDAVALKRTDLWQQYFRYRDLSIGGKFGHLIPFLYGRAYYIEKYLDSWTLRYLEDGGEVKKIEESLRYYLSSLSMAVIYSQERECSFHGVFLFGDLKYYLQNVDLNWYPSEKLKHATFIWKLKRLMNALVYGRSFDTPPVNADLRLKLIEELKLFFDAGVTPQVDELWKQVKLSPFKLD